MKRIICLITAVILITLVSGCGKKKPVSKTETPATNVTVYTVGTGDVANKVSYTGEILEGEYVSVTSKISAKATEILVDAGDFVKAGTVLARLDSTDLQLTYNQARASYNSAAASYDMTANASTKQSETAANQALSKAQIEYNDAQNAYNRQKSLYDNDTSIISAQNALNDSQQNLDRTQQLFDMGAATQVSLDSAKTAVENAKANLEAVKSSNQTALDNAKTRLNNAQLSLASAKENRDLQVGVMSQKTIATSKAAVDSAKANLDIAANNLKNTTITAPIDGYISAKNLTKGQMASPGVEVFSIKNTNRVDAEIKVTEADIPFVTVGTSASVTVKSTSLGTIEGTVTMVNPTKDEKTGLYTVRVSIPNQNGTIKVGMFADINLTLQENNSVLTIPSESIMQNNDEYYIYIASADGKTAKKSVVTKGIENAETTEITSGVKNGDKVIIKGKEYLSEKNNQINITK